MLDMTTHQKEKSPQSGHESQRHTRSHSQSPIKYFSFLLSTYLMKTHFQNIVFSLSSRKLKSLRKLHVIVFPMILFALIKYPDTRLYESNSLH